MNMKSGEIFITKQKFLTVPDVWSPLGPVLAEPLGPDPIIQSNSSASSLV